MNAAKSILLVGMPNWSVTMPFHALAQVAALARDAGWKVTVRDINVDFYHAVDAQERGYWEERHTALWFGSQIPGQLLERYRGWFNDCLEQALIDAAPDLVAFSVNMSTRYFSIYAARQIRRLRPGLPILFGGVDCFPREQGTAFLEPGGYCDVILQGEAEIALPKFLDGFAPGQPVTTEVPGFAYLDGDRVVNRGQPELPTLKGDLPIPAYEFFDLSRYTVEGKFPFFLSRGCVYNCTFCSEGPNFIRYRFRDPEEAFAELTAIQQFMPEPASGMILSMADSIINANVKTLRGFARRIIDAGLRVQWGGQGHIHAKMDAGMFALLKEAGFSSVFWGIESGSQHVVDLMNKRYNQKVAREVMDECVRQGIAQHIPIIVGHPGETTADFVDTLDLILRYRRDCHCAVPGVCMIRPNSPLHDDFERFNLANNHPYEWCDKDGTNTLPLRLVRRFFAMQAAYNLPLSWEEIQDTGEIAAVDIDEPLVSREYFEVLREMARRGGFATSLTGSLARCAAAGRFDPALFTGDPEPDAAPGEVSWRRLPKNGREERADFYRFLLAVMGRYDATLPRIAAA